MTASPSDGGRDDLPHILAVDDQERVCQAVELWLGDDYRIETATSGTEALEKMGDRIDVVLLDRHMPDMSGGEVLDRIRDHEYDCRVAMVTAVDPDFDIVDMPFDDYVSKPVKQDDLRTAIEKLLSIDTYGEQMSALYSVSQKIASLETGKRQTELNDSKRYNDLIDRRAELRSELDQLITTVDDMDGQTLFGLVGDSDEQ